MALKTSTSRKRFQISLGAMLVVMALTAVAATVATIPIRRQRLAVQAIEALGGHVVYDFQSTGAKAPPGPAWLRRVIGNEWFQSAVGVHLHGSHVDTPEGLHTALSRIRRLPGIRFLTIHSQHGLNDANLREVAKMRGLAGLVLDGGPLADADIALVAQLSKLEHLTLLGSFSDAALAHLRNLGELRDLELGRNVTDAGLANLNGLTNMVSLTCNSGRVSSSQEWQTEFDFRNVAPRDAVEYLANRFELKWRFDDDAIKAAGIDVGPLVITDTASNLTLQKALDRILTPLGLGFRIVDDVLVITTRAAADQAHAGVAALRRSLPKLRHVEVGW